LLQLASDGIRRDYTQSLFDQANYTFQEKDGHEPVNAVKETLGDYFSRKKRAAQVHYEMIIFRCSVLKSCEFGSVDIQ
jgi:hypothetical protein